jgi:streptogramin lyase
VVVTLAGSTGEYGSADGSKTMARFNGPVGLSVDGNGNIFVADTANDTVREISAAGVVSTVIGAGNNRSNRDGTGAAAQFNSPHGVVVDLNGNVFVGDTSNNTIRKITPSGVVTTLAGSPGAEGTADGAGSAARFFHLTNLAIDANDNIYVADTGNHAIRKVTQSGVVTTFAGLPGPGNFGSTDGAGTAARFNQPFGIAVDADGYVYIGDLGNETIRKITPDGVVSTLAGTPGIIGSNNGTGAAAQFHNSLGVAVDSNKNVYVTDANNNLIRKITPDGVVTTLAGEAGVSGSSDGTGSSARFYVPQFITIDLAGNLLFRTPSTSRSARSHRREL